MIPNALRGPVFGANDFFATRRGGVILRSRPVVESMWKSRRDLVAVVVVLITCTARGGRAQGSVLDGEEGSEPRAEPAQPQSESGQRRAFFGVASSEWGSYASPTTPSESRPSETAIVDEASCSLEGRGRAPLPEECRTPRMGTLSGVFIALDFGLVTMKERARARAQVGAGPIAEVRIGMAFWDQLIFGLEFGGYSLHDRDPFFQNVVTCRTVEGVVTSCDDASHPARSRVSGTFLSFDSGYQKRFRPSETTSLSIGAWGGYLAMIARLSRGIGGCVNCGDLSVDAAPSGFYLAPFLRMTVGREGRFALALRSRWFVTGDLAQMSTLGLEYGLP